MISIRDFLIFCVQNLFLFSIRNSDVLQNSGAQQELAEVCVQFLISIKNSLTMPRRILVPRRSFEVFFFEFLSSIRNSLICCGILIKRRHSSICFVKVRRQGKMFRSIFFISDLKLEIILFFIFFFLEHCNSKRSNFDLFF